MQKPVDATKVVRMVAVYTIAGACVAAVTWATLAVPILGLGLLAVALFAVWAWLRPVPASVSLAFLTAAFPKAGVKLGEFPFPIFLLGLFASILLMAARSPRRNIGSMAGLAVFAYASWIVVRGVIFTQDGPSQTFAFLAWSLLPILLLAVSSTVVTVDPRFTRALQLGFLVSVAFAFVQQIGGVSETAVPGLTYAFGDDLTQKFNSITLDSGAELTKIPSTYQNGNVYGVTAAVFLVYSVDRIFSGRAKKLDYIVSLGAVAAIGLSGSRTAVLGAFVGALYLLLRSRGIGRKLVALAAAAVVIMAVVYAQPDLIGRYSIDLIFSTGGAGRASQWQGALAQLSPVDFMFGTGSRTLAEGWAGILMQIGVVGIALLVVTVGSLIGDVRAWRAPLMVLLVAAIVDSTYVVFPTWFLPVALLMGSTRTVPAGGRHMTIRAQPGPGELSLTSPMRLSSVGDG